jgi:hypothetical protein
MRTFYQNGLCEMCDTRPQEGLHTLRNYRTRKPISKFTCDLCLTRQIKSGTFVKTLALVKEDRRVEGHDRRKPVRRRAIRL